MMDLSHYHCTLCDSDVYRDSGYWGCDCYEIPIEWLETGTVDIPDFWKEKEEAPDDQ